MKILFILLTILTSFSAVAVSLIEIEGTYRVTTVSAPIENTISISIDGSVVLIEKSPYGIFECSGEASLIKDILTSSVICENGSQFFQRINLEGITDFSNFTVNVYSSLYDAELPMTFLRVE